MPEHVERRHLALEGAPNFRDLGGYATEDGRRVKWGLFFRSDHLHNLTDADLERFQALGIRLVCDFRSPEERSEEPDRLPAQNPPEVADLGIWDEGFSAGSLREKIRSGDIEGEDFGELLVRANRMFATRFADRYAAMFARITRPENLPALVHCTAGKDRAGFASALILRVLGVPVETIYEDFLLTNHYAAEKIERTILRARVFSFFQIDGERLRPLLGVERRYLEAAFDTIDEEYGSFETYRRSVLGLDDATLRGFRTIALD
jgi:protein-tyrosine phosphatase